MVIGALAAMAQQSAHAEDAAPETKQLERVEVTGSLIRRTIEDEGALPVTIIRAADIARTGITTVEQLLATVVGAQNAGSGSFNTSNAVGASTGGASTASLKGLGPNYTLVLLNGQRLAGFAYNPGVTDINSIPLAAIDRVEILRDGASSRYGSDAIGGVINFITKRSYTGFSAEADQGSTDQTGGTTRHFSFSGGFGDLDKEGFNVIGAYSLERQQSLTTLQRSYATAASAAGISSNTSPANYKQLQGTGPGATVLTYNPSAPGCVPPIYIPKGDNQTCRAASGLYFDLIPYSSQNSFYGKVSFKLPADNLASLEYVRSEHHVTIRVSPDPHGGLSMATNSPFFPGAGITPAPPASAGVIDPTIPLGLSFRTAPAGKRTDGVLSTEDRLAAALKGSAGSFDYEATIFTTHNRVSQANLGGYVSQPALQDLIDGTNTQGLNPTNLFLNPFGSNTPAANAALLATEITGEDLSASMGSRGLNASVSTEVGKLDGGPISVAVGGEARKESFAYNVNDSVAALTFGSTGIAPGSTVPEKTRNVTAIYAELLAPLTKEIEADLALRTDHYDGFGSSTNPKISLRYQPTKAFLLRGSAATGFRAPDLYQLYQAQSVTNTASAYSDPFLCPNGTPLAGAVVDPTVSCDVQQNLLLGGNPTLKAEKSKQYTFGIVLQPIPDLQISVDAWAVKIKDQVRSPGEGALYNNSGKFAASKYVTCANAGNQAQFSSACGPSEPAGTLAYAVDLLDNIGQIDARGVDLGINYAFTTSRGQWKLGYELAYINRYTYQLFAGAPDVSNLGVYSNDLNQPIFRFQHQAALSWKQENWTGDLVNHFRSGYTDSNANGEDHHVPQSWSWDAGVGYSGFKNVTLSLVVRNLLDAPPPFSNQGATFQKGYDPYSGDPLGRVYFFSAKYEIK
jgi:iron complex outermembrane receptor protein